MDLWRGNGGGCWRFPARLIVTRASNISGELPEDTFEAFLSAPVIARNKVVGVINVQHRQAHQHTGGEMEVLTTLGEQVGCAHALARLSPLTMDSINHADLDLSGGPVRRRA